MTKCAYCSNHLSLRGNISMHATSAILFGPLTFVVHTLSSTKYLQTEMILFLAHYLSLWQTINYCLYIFSFYEIYPINHPALATKGSTHAIGVDYIIQMFSLRDALNISSKNIIRNYVKTICNSLNFFMIFSFYLQQCTAQLLHRFPYIQTQNIFLLF